MKDEKADRVLIYESEHSGHHLYYLKAIVEALGDGGTEIVLGLSDISHAAIARDMPELLQAATAVLELPVTAGLPFRQVSHTAVVGTLQRCMHFMLTIRLARRLGCSAILVCYLDSVLPVVSLPFSTPLRMPLSGILMRASFHHVREGVPGARPRLASTLRLLFFQMLMRRRSVRQVLTIDPTAVAASPNPKVGFLPDTANPPKDSDRAKAREYWGVGQTSRKIVMCFGALSGRKQIRLLLETAEQSDDYLVLLVGQCDPEIRTLLASPLAAGLAAAGKLVAADRKATDHEEDLAYVASDIVWVNYRDHEHMSGLMVKAALSRRTIVACNNGLIGWYAIRRGVALVVDDNTPAGVLPVLARASDPAVSGPLIARASEEFKDAGFLNFSRRICAFVRNGNDARRPVADTRMEGSRKRHAQ